MPDALTGVFVVQALIGNNLVKQLRPSEKPFEVRDTRLGGFLLRVQPTGRMTFYVEYARGKRAKLGGADAISVDQARVRAKKVLGEAYQGGDPQAAMRRVQAVTFAGFVDEVFRPWAEANIRTANAAVARLRRNFPDFQKKKLADISPWLVEKWRAGRLKAGASAATVNRDLDDLKSAFAKATAWGQLDQNPLASVKRGRIDAARTPRYLSNDEISRLHLAFEAREERIRVERDRANAWRQAREYRQLLDLRTVAFADHLRPMVILSLATGMRRGEVFNLTWDAVNLAARRVTVLGSKAKSLQTRHLPLHREAAAALQGWRDQTKGDGLVFPGRDGKPFNNVRRAWEGLLAEAGIENFRWHDQRHDFASQLVMAGVDLNTVRELLGHSDYKMTLRYAHLAPEHKASAVERLVR
jgi:integrase